MKARYEGSGQKPKDSAGAVSAGVPKTFREPKKLDFEWDKSVKLFIETIFGLICLYSVVDESNQLTASQHGRWRSYELCRWGFSGKPHWPDKSKFTNWYPLTEFTPLPEITSHLLLPVARKSRWHADFGHLCTQLAPNQFR